jgi:cholesterol transport system auxiliary component
MSQIITYAILFIALTINGCSLTPVSKQPKTNRIIHADFGKQSSSKAQTKLVLLVQRPQANVGYQSQAMMYMPTKHVLATYSNNQWAVPPDSMLQNIIISEIEASNYFKDVIPQAGIAHYDYKLVTQLIALRQEFWTSPSRVRMVFDASLVEPGSNQLIVSRRFNITENAPGNDPDSGAKAANKAAIKLSKRVSWLIRHSIDSLNELND